MEKYDVYLKKFKVAVGILVATIVLAGVIVSKIIPEIQKITNIQKDYKSQSSALADSERKLENLKNAEKARKVQDEVVVKVFYKPINATSDTETAISDEYSEILQLVRENKIKIRSIKYDYDPQDDSFVKNASSKYHVCRITSEMIAEYSNFENFLRDLYKHEHFIEISKVEILPYERNKKILLVNLQIKLYAQKGQGATLSDNPDEGRERSVKSKSLDDKNVSPELSQ